jgi:cytoskeleton protein RodZ
MAAFGENLRREREMRGVTLEEISAATKISVRFLQAIEREDFETLPGGVFTRSFIRTYARYLGLDEERVMAEYHLAGQPPADVDLPPLAASRLPAQRSGTQTTLLALLVAGVMLSAAYLLFRYSRRSPEIRQPTDTGRGAEVQGGPPSPERVPATTAAAPSAATSPSGPQHEAVQGGTPAPATPPNPPGTPAGSTNPAPARAINAPVARPGTAEAQSGLPALGQAQGGEQGRTAQAGTAPPAGKVAGSESGLVLQVAATESTWVGIEADGQTVLQRVLRPNEVRTLKARDSFDVTTGNAQGIILTLNGETLKPLGRRGEVKSIHLTHDDLKNPAP